MSQVSSLPPTPSGYDTIGIQDDLRRVKSSEVLTVSGDCLCFSSKAKCGCRHGRFPHFRIFMSFPPIG